MRTLTLASVSLCVLLLPMAARPCGFDPCDRAGYRDASALDAKILRPGDWRYQRLPALIAAYLGEGAAAAVAAGAGAAEDASTYDAQRASRASYEAAVAGVFAALGRPAPALPEAVKVAPAWDGVCARNDYDAAARWLEAIRTDAALVRHAEQLVTWRTRIVGLCPADREPVDALVAEMQTAAAAAPAIADAVTYLVGTVRFYTGGAAEAALGFDAASRAGNAWIREAGAYSVGRALLVAAQSNWDGYSASDGIDRATMARAREAFGAYVARFPRGRFAQSAIGLERRIAKLEGDNARMNALIVERFAQWLDVKAFDAIGRTGLSEIANYLDLSALTVDTFPFEHPMLAATLRPHVPRSLRTPRPPTRAWSVQDRATRPTPASTS